MTPTPTVPTACWPIDFGCTTPEDLASIPADVMRRSVAMAERTMERLTIGRVGGCPITVRPCPQNRSQGLALVAGGSSFVNPYQGADGHIYNAVPCVASCAGSCELDMGGVVGRVDSIKVDGVELDIVGKLVLIDGHIIGWRGSGPCPFAHAQDLSLADSAVGTWSLTYLPRVAVDEYGAYALGLLAYEFAKACLPGAKNCRLPKNVTAVVRQGVSYNVVPGLFLNGQTGVEEIDRYIVQWNPRGLKAMPTFWSPDSVDHRIEQAL